MIFELSESYYKCWLLPLFTTFPFPFKVLRGGKVVPTFGRIKDTSVEIITATTAVTVESVGVNATVSY